MTHDSLTGSYTGRSYLALLVVLRGSTHHLHSIRTQKVTSSNRITWMTAGHSVTCCSYLLPIKHKGFIQKHLNVKSVIPKLSKWNHFTSNVWSLAVRFQLLTAQQKIFPLHTSIEVFSNRVKREKKQDSLLTWCNVTKSVRMVMVKVCHIVAMIDMKSELNRLVCMSMLLFVRSSVGLGHRCLNHSFDVVFSSIHTFIWRALHRFALLPVYHLLHQWWKWHFGLHVEMHFLCTLEEI